MLSSVTSRRDPSSRVDMLVMGRMRFCEKCGSYMHISPGRYSCPKCGNETHDQVVEVRRIERHDAAPVDVIDESEIEYVKVKERCPRCGNLEAFRRVSVVAGEHAGIRQERSIERLRCTKCQHLWSRT